VHARRAQFGCCSSSLQVLIGPVLLALDTGTAVADVSVTHPGGVAVRAAAAATDGAAAKRREGENRLYGRLEPNG
jgi:hypothetical protein